MKTATQMGRIRAAKLDGSPRLQRVMRVLDEGDWVGTMEIVHRAQVCAVNSCIAELRANGIEIESRCQGQGLWEYRLAGGREAA